MKRGEIYIVNFGKKYNSEFVLPSVRDSAKLHGKLRPALIIQNDVANRNIDKVDFKGVTLIPLTTNISGGNLRVQIEPRDNLKQLSEICINELCTLDLSRIQLDNTLTTLNDSEINEVNDKLLKHLGF